MKVETISGSAPIALPPIDNIRQLLSVRIDERRFEGHLDFRWFKDASEPPAFVALRDAALAHTTVDGTDPILGAVRLRVSQWRITYDANRDWFEATVCLEGTKR